MSTRIRGAAIALTALLAMLVCATPALAADRNHNKIPDSWEHRYKLSTKANLANRDSDKDGLTNYQEWRAGTNPKAKDTDKDHLSDANEDRDRDGLTNIGEVKSKTNLRVADTDKDGILDSREDPDRDRLRNAQEIQVRTNPLKSDTDRDGVTDGCEDRDGDGIDNKGEFAQGTDPCDGDSDDDGIDDGAEVSGVVISYDTLTGVLSLKSFNEAGTTYNIAVTAETQFEWAGKSHGAPKPTSASLLPGTVVKEAETRTLSDGTLQAKEIELRPVGSASSLVARIEEFNSATSLLTLEAAQDDDCEYGVLVDPGTVFTWAPGVSADHEATLADLTEGTGVMALDVITNDAGVKVATRLVLVPRADRRCDFERNED